MVCLLRCRKLSIIRGQTAASQQTDWLSGATKTAHRTARQDCGRWIVVRPVMNVFGLFSGRGMSRRSLAVAAALVGTVSLAIGAHAALNRRSPDVAKVAASEQDNAAKRPSRIALVIGNGHYPDANAPLTQPVN